MINFSAIRSRSWFGKLLRAPLNLVPDNAVMPILQGPLKGNRWIAGAATHGCWLGSYELDKQMAMVAHIRPDQVVYDIGANVGFYTLLAAKQVGSGGYVIAFEPFERNIQFLKRHIALNRLNNVTIETKAVGAENGQAFFQEGNSPSMGHLAAVGIPVELITVDTVAAAGHAPDVLKIDVEGAELDVLKGASHTLTDHSPIIFLATHGEHVHQACIDFLHQHAYTVEGIDGQSVDKTDELYAYRSASG
ncbi:MAG: FkbM family methyltransferase [Anaerolineae bacterium]|nr:FkbM family methyltransferase [Anaerolineae bacterium]